MESLREQCERKYGIDFNQRISQILPYFWSFTISTGIRKQVFINYVETLFSQFKSLNDNFVDTCFEIEQKLSYNGQIFSLEKLLNDTYDFDNRRIFIKDFNLPFASGVFIYLDGEDEDGEDDIYLDNETNPTSNFYFLDNENISTGSEIVNFTVNVPNDISITDEQILNLLSIYVIAGMIYNIKRF